MYMELSCFLHRLSQELGSPPRSLFIQSGENGGVYSIVDILEEGIPLIKSNNPKAKPFTISKNSWEVSRVYSKGTGLRLKGVYLIIK